MRFRPQTAGALEVVLSARSRSPGCVFFKEPRCATRAEYNATVVLAKTLPVTSKQESRIVHRLREAHGLDAFVARTSVEERLKEVLNPLLEGTRGLREDKSWICTIKLARAMQQAQSYNDVARVAHRRGNSDCGEST